MTPARRIVLAHGGGGQLTGELIRQLILPALGWPGWGGQDPKALSDAAEVAVGRLDLLFTTDGYVVWPIEFPGGDIGKLSVCGTINDLAVAGAQPVAISLGLVLEEGLELDVLERVLRSAGRAAAEAGVAVVTGDTKVVERRGEPTSVSPVEPGMMIHTSGLGRRIPQARLGFECVREGDAIVLSGPLGQHGLAVMCRRQGLRLAGSLQSDCACLHRLTASLLGELGAEVHWMRDPTRGGLAGVLADLSSATGRSLEVREEAIPTDPAVLAAAEILGLDLLNAANEGKLVAVVSAEAAPGAVAVLRRHDLARAAVVIGNVGAGDEFPLVEMITRAGGRRVVQMPYGEDLPRIC